MADQEEDHGVGAIGKLIEVLKPMNPDTRINVLQFVFKELNITIPGATGPAHIPPIVPTIPHASPAQPVPPAAPGAITDLRSLREQKQPKNANQMVAVMAYYLAHHAPERRDYITPDDIKRFFPQAGFELPTGPPSQTLVNAKNGGYLEQIATGQYRLNPVGHNLVTHRLPAGDSNSGGGTRRRTAKRAKKATKKKKARK
ncbi:hypothetical protein [Bradyrhizobium sp.]|uniref:hypothetical protein n=1 Tax=Bradyrhizobium sp. TaxID=376 RepID=UPI002D2EA598|nr:hypothetical protein [Bradyrhizobium sp.]HZR73096.1 hypothetical protein [Bradyrhizobium sp.]